MSDKDFWYCAERYTVIPDRPSREETKPKMTIKRIHAREQLVKIVELILTGVKFVNNGGKWVRTVDGRMFLASHWETAKGVAQRIKKDGFKEAFLRERKSR